jgi:hypothetical protein
MYVRSQAFHIIHRIWTLLEASGDAFRHFTPKVTRYVMMGYELHASTAYGIMPLKSPKFLSPTSDINLVKQIPVGKGLGITGVPNKCLQYIFIASGVGLSPLYCGHFWPIVPAPDDR